MVADPVHVGRPLAVLVQYSLLLVPAAPAYVLVASFALVDPLQLATIRARVQKVELGFAELADLGLVAFVQQFAQHFYYGIAIAYY